MSRHDQMLQVFGRKPVLEAFDAGLQVAKVHVAEAAHGPEIEQIVAGCRAHGVELERVSAARVSAIAHTGRHHQGVVADVVAERMQGLGAFLDGRRGRRFATSVLVLDHVHNPANVGMILRVALAAGIDGVVLPDEGSAPVGAVAIKASAGTAFRAPILRCSRLEDALGQLADARFDLVGVDTGGASLWEALLPERAAYVLGNESDGLSDAARAACTATVSLPLANNVESLNVATTAAVLAYELQRTSLRPTS